MDDPPPRPGRDKLSVADRDRLDVLFEQFSELSPRSVGYPCNQAWDYSELFRFLQFAANNVGDPFEGSNYSINSHEIEREVVEDFGRFTEANPEDFWGYVTNGGTEGNMYGLYLARELFPQGIVYFSEDTHYSVTKILRLQHTRNIMLKSQDNGELDYDDLRESVRLNRDTPPIVFANIGTTMKGAVDDLSTIRQIMDDLAIREYYIHCDAALSGMILPFLDNPPPWTFADGADSISISGHKMIGSPLPCGLALAKRRFVERVARSVEYVGVLDTTISGSRSAFTPLILWYALRTLGEEGLAANAKRSLELARYTVSRFQDRGVDAWRNLNSVTVVFPRPAESVMRKWIVAPNRDIGHLIALPHMTEETIDAFINDYCGARQPDPTADGRHLPASKDPRRLGADVSRAGIT
ncbi:MAG: histidine decarboxylase [Verrucomicrobiales bacterium]|jgi:histidine decarboxylase